MAYVRKKQYNTELMKTTPQKTYPIYELIAGLFVMTLIVSNIASVKLVSAGPFVFDAGTILFPLAYIIGDIITEVYGFRRMRTLLGVGIITLILTALTFWAVGVLPAASDWANQPAYESILGVVWRIVFASIIAIGVGELINSYVLAKLKIKTEGRNLWARIVGSSAAGSMVDTVIFSVIAFAGTMPLGVLLQLIATVYTIKMVTEIVVSPLTMVVIRAIKRREGIDAYEQPTFKLS